MRRFLMAVCLLAHSSYGMPQQQRGVQLGGGQPRPVTYASPAPPQNFGPSYSQQLSFGPSDARSTAGAYRSPQPIILQQGSPSPFANFPSPTPFPSQVNQGPSRGPIQALRTGPTPTPASDDEYEEYDDEEEAPKPQIQVTGGPIQRAPPRISQPISSFSQGGPQRLVIPQSQPQSQAQGPVRQRQQAPQRQPTQQPIQQYAQPQQSQRAQQPAPAPQQQSRGVQSNSPSYGIDGKRARLTTPPPIQTLNRYMRQNEDGSITWGYENEDGTFKEETYVDPDGQKREYEYQSGNPCDPNKKNQEEEELEEVREGPGPQQQAQGVIHAGRPRPQQQQQQRRPVPQVQQYQPQPQFS